jgi:tectonic-1/3
MLLPAERGRSAALAAPPPPPRLPLLLPPLLLLLLLLLLLSPLAAAQPQLPPDWTVVTAFPWPALESPPPGCACQSASCAQFDCGCVCDLHAGECDANCCCDADCSALEVARFRGLGACRPQGPQNLSLASCLSPQLSQSLALVNPRARMSVQSSSAGADAVLCVAVDNSPVLGSFLADPGLLPPATLDAAGVARAESFRRPSPAAAAAAAALAATQSFDVGARVPARKAGPGGALVAAFGGSWRLPAPGGGGGGGSGASGAAPCGLAAGAAFVRFRGDVAPPQQCLYTAPLSAAACADLSPAAYVGGLLVGAFPAAAAARDFVQVALGSVSFVDAASGGVLAGVGAAASSWDEASCTCAHALVGLHYSVTYVGASMRIAAVAAHVVVSNVSQPPGLCGFAAVSVPVTTGVSFVPQSLSAAAPVLGRSGGPGYVKGLPVLAGVLVTQAGAPLGGAAPAAGDLLVVARSAPAHSLLASFANLAAGYGFELAGLSLRGPAADGSCALAPAPGSAAGLRDDASAVPVGFGEDLAVSCALDLTPQQLQALCAGGGGAASPTSAFVGLGSVLLAGAAGGAAPVTHVGVLGNADPYKPWQWLALAAGAAQQAPSWDTTGVFPQCANMPSGVDVELLVAAVGSAGNPQYKVVSARVSYPTSTWTFGREAGGAARTQRFLMTSTVTFTTYSGDPTVVWKPAPPIIPPMPADLWYPFMSGQTPSQLYVPANGGAGAAAAVSAAGALLAVAAALRLALQ